ncbi:hypothetical protein PSM7751_00719 [Pseudooceanicola marinus]|uniref:Uncharacterized protein n=1 Tax=Pseudooceanicola marinus TaxID=396013 RepID=A0A1X6YHA3_9RHOB|nr:hypothetical protein [Pseudooceanicola marinus]SLN20878.1 hypothetical protein PSM7751_00719 [Pseudooceanicola marinus]
MIGTIPTGTTLAQGTVVSIDRTLCRRSENGWKPEHIEVATVSAGGRILRILIEHQIY